MAGGINAHQSTIGNSLGTSIWRIKQAYEAGNSAPTSVLEPEPKCGSLRLVSISKNCIPRSWSIPRGITAFSEGCLFTLIKLEEYLEPELFQNLIQKCVPSIEPTQDEFVVDGEKVSMSIDEVFCWIGVSLSTAPDGYVKFARYLSGEGTGYGLDTVCSTGVRNYLIPGLGALGANTAEVEGFHDIRVYVYSQIDAYFPKVFNAICNEREDSFALAAKAWLSLDPAEGSFQTSVLPELPSDGSVQLFRGMRDFVMDKLSKLGIQEASDNPYDQDLLSKANELLGDDEIDRYLRYHPKLMVEGRELGSGYYLVRLLTGFSETPRSLRMRDTLSGGNKIKAYDRLSRLMIDMHEIEASMNKPSIQGALNNTLKTQWVEFQGLSRQLKLNVDEFNEGKVAELKAVMEPLNEHIRECSNSNFVNVENFFAILGSSTTLGNKLKLTLYFKSANLAVSDEFIRRNMKADESGEVIISPYSLNRILLHALSQPKPWSPLFMLCFDSCLALVEKRFEGTPLAGVLVESSYTDDLKKRLIEARDGGDPSPGMSAVFRLARRLIPEALVFSWFTSRVAELKHLEGFRFVVFEMLSDRERLAAINDFKTMHDEFKKLSVIEGAPAKIIELVSRGDVLSKIHSPADHELRLNLIKSCLDGAPEIISEMIREGVDSGGLNNPRILFEIFNIIRDLPRGRETIFLMLDCRDIRVKFNTDYYLFRLLELMKKIEGGPAKIFDPSIYPDIYSGIREANYPLEIMRPLKKLEGGHAKICEMLDDRNIYSKIVSKPGGLGSLICLMEDFDEGLAKILGFIDKPEFLEIIPDFSDLHQLFAIVNTTEGGSARVLEVASGDATLNTLKGEESLSLFLQFISGIPGGEKKIIDIFKERDVYMRFRNQYLIRCLCGFLKDLDAGPEIIFCMLREEDIDQVLSDYRNLIEIFKILKGLPRGPENILALFNNYHIRLRFVEGRSLLALLRFMREIEGGSVLLFESTNFDAIRDTVRRADNRLEIIKVLANIEGGPDKIRELLSDSVIHSRISKANCLQYVLGLTQEVDPARLKLEKIPPAPSGVVSASAGGGGGGGGSAGPASATVFAGSADRSRHSKRGRKERTGTDKMNKRQRGPES